MFNLPSNLYNLPWFQNLQNGGFGNKAKWSEISPFRTVNGAGQFGSGLNASAGQLYEHFGDKVNRDRQNGLDTTLLDYGFRRAAPPQTMEDFLNRRNPKPPELPVTTPIAPPKLPGTIPGLPPGFQMPDLSKFSIFNMPQFGQRNSAPPSPQQPVVSTGMPMVNRPQPGGTPPQAVPFNMGNALQQTPGVRPQPQTMPSMPQVPQFDPSIFNMQPQMMNQPRRAGGF